MAELYFDAVNGLDTNAGTAAAPFKTWWTATPAAAISGMANNSTLYFRGQFQPPYIAGTSRNLGFTGKTGCSIRQWPGKAQFIIRRDNLITVSTDGWGTWSNIGTDLVQITQTTPGNTPIKSVCWNYGRMFDSHGRTLPFLRRIATVAEETAWNAGSPAVLMASLALVVADATAARALVAVTPWSYFYDTVTLPGQLNLNIPGIGASVPTTNTIDGQVSWNSNDPLHGGIGCVNSPNTVIDGVQIWLVDPMMDGGAYGINCQGCTDLVVSNCTVRDCGYHGIGFTGGPTRNVTIKNCEIWGGYAKGSGIVFYAQAGENVTGCRVINSVIHNYIHLCCDGTSVFNVRFTATPTTLAQAKANRTESYLSPAGGIYSHTSGYPYYIDDYEIRDTVVKTYTTEPTYTRQESTGNWIGSDGFHGVSFGYAAVKSTPNATDPLDYTQYPVRVIDCSFEGGSGVNVSHCAFVRCNISGETVFPSGGFGLGRPYVFINEPDRRNTAFISCEVIFNYKNYANPGGSESAMMALPSSLSATVSIGGASLKYDSSIRRLYLTSGKFPYHCAAGDRITLNYTADATNRAYFITAADPNLTWIEIAANRAANDGTAGPNIIPTDAAGLTITLFEGIAHNWSYYFVNCSLITNYNPGMGSKQYGATFFNYAFGAALEMSAKIGITCHRCILAVNPLSNSVPSNSNSGMLYGTANGSGEGGFGMAQVNTPNGRVFITEGRTGTEWAARFSFKNNVYYNISPANFSAQRAPGYSVISAATWVDPVTGNDKTGKIVNPGLYGSTSDITPNGYIANTPAVEGLYARYDIRNNPNYNLIGCQQNVTLNGLRSVRNVTPPLYRNSARNITPFSGKVIQIDLGP